MNLDGWVTVEGAEIQDTDDKISPFMTPSEATGKPNKTITEKECELSYMEVLLKLECLFVVFASGVLVIYGISIIFVLIMRTWKILMFNHMVDCYINLL